MILYVRTYNIHDYCVPTGLQSRAQWMRDANQIKCES